MAYSFVFCSIHLLFSIVSLSLSLSIFVCMNFDTNSNKHILVVALSFTNVQLICEPMNYSQPSTSYYGISQSRILEWVAISYARGSSQPRNGTHVSCASCIGRQILYHCSCLTLKYPGGYMPICLSLISIYDYVFLIT